MSSINEARVFFEDTSHRKNSKKKEDTSDEEIDQEAMGNIQARSVDILKHKAIKEIVENFGFELIDYFENFEKNDEAGLPQPKLPEMLSAFLAYLEYTDFIRFNPTTKL